MITDPLGFNQERRVLFEDWARHSNVPFTAFNLTAARRLVGAVDVAALEAALGDLVQRHTILRSSIDHPAGVSAEFRDASFKQLEDTGIASVGLYRQAETDCGGPTLQVVTGPAVDVDREQVRALVAREATVAFNCRHPPHLRALLIQAGPADHLLAVVIPHAFCDGWGFRLLLRDLWIAYERRTAANTATEWSAAPAFRDFATQQHEQFAAGKFAAAIAYWRSQWRELSEMQLTLSDVPFATDQGATSSDAVALSCRTVVDVALSRELKQAARRLSTTLFVLFFTGFALLLRAYSGKQRLGIWTHFLNRRDGDAEETLGWCANSHLIGVDLSDTVNGEEALRRTRTAVLNAATHHELPLALLWLDWGRRLDTSDLRVSLDQRARGIETSVVGSTAVRPVDLSIAPGIVDLAATLIDGHSGLQLWLTYSPQRFEAGAMRSLLESWLAIVRSLVSAPEQPLSAHHSVLSEVGMTPS